MKASGVSRSALKRNKELSALYILYLVKAQRPTKPGLETNAVNVHISIPKLRVRKT